MRPIALPLLAVAVALSIDILLASETAQAQSSSFQDTRNISDTAASSSADVLIVLAQGATSDDGQSQEGLEDPVPSETPSQGGGQSGSGNGSSSLDNGQSQVGLVDPTPAPLPAPVDIPQNGLRVVYASSNVEGAAAVIDGDTGTKWTVSGPWPQEIVIELPETYLVTDVKYIHGDKVNYLTKYSIFVSEDGQNWINTSAPGTLKNTSLIWQVRLSWPRYAKYVRVVYMASGGGDSITTAEISIISDPSTPAGSEPPSVTPSSPPAPAPTPSPTPSGQVCYTLGGKDVPAEDFDVSAQWQAMMEVDQDRIGGFESVLPQAPL